MNIAGLTDTQVLESKQQYGDNRLTEIESESFWDKLLGNFGDPMIKILIVALLINVTVYVLGLFGVPVGHSEWYESLGIAIAIILATFVSTFSEYRNENAFQKLQEEASRIMVKVFRNNDVTEISIDDLVVGDYVLLQSGDKIPADGVMFEGNIKVDQSVLNGESKEATKKEMPKDYVDEDVSMDFLNEYKLFRGSVVSSGNGVMLVTTVGDKSVYGKIASELQVDEDRDSPLKVKLSTLAGHISKFGYFGGLAIALAFLLQKMISIGFYEFFTRFESINDVVYAVILAVIIIVMAVPEGLPLMIAIVSALNMGKMLKDNVLVRKIVGIETAGSLNILFSDKTGTITKGKLEAVVFVDGKGANFENASKLPGDLSKLLKLCIFENTNAVISGEGSKIKIIGGNPTERAVLGFVAGQKSDAKVSRVHSIPFNSTNKYSATEVSGEYNFTLIKGAPERIIARCNSCFDENGNVVNMESSRAVEEQIDLLAQRAIRVLALAVSTSKLGETDLPEGNDWTLIGVLGIRDEVRPESVTAISEVQQAGVQVVMITGDRKDTATAIAKEAGLLKHESDIILASDEVQKLSDDELKRKLPNIKVISRALPSDKSRFVRIAQELNLVVGMTGDGVNDSPALKKADVGFAMGSGTEVAKEASDIVILDDNFNSIDKAILYGRTIFNSIRKFIIFQLTINVAAVLITFISPLLGMDPPLGIIQILWVNLVMDTLAALAFGGEPALKRFMKEKPKSRSEHIVSPYMWSAVLTSGAWIVACSLFMLLTPFASGFFTGTPDVSVTPEASRDLAMKTGFFTFFVFAAVFNGFNARTDRINLFDNIGRNKGFFAVIGLIVVVQVIMAYVGGAVLDCYGLTLQEWGFILILAVTIIPVDIIRKSFFVRKASV